MSFSESIWTGIYCWTSVYHFVDFLCYFYGGFRHFIDAINTLVATCQYNCAARSQVKSNHHEGQLAHRPFLYQTQHRYTTNITEVAKVSERYIYLYYVYHTFMKVVIYRFGALVVLLKVVYSIFCPYYSHCFCNLPFKLAMLNIFVQFPSYYAEAKLTEYKYNHNHFPALFPLCVGHGSLWMLYSCTKHK